MRALHPDSQHSEKTRHDAFVLFTSKEKQIAAPKKLEGFVDLAEIYRNFGG